MRRHALGTGLALLCALLFAFLPGSVSASHPPEYELVESFGPDGTESASFTHAGSTAVDQVSDLVYVLDDKAGILYKFDSEGNPVNWGGSAPYIDGHKISGLTFPPFSEWEHQVAVDSASHKIYVTDANSLRAFLPNGEPAEFTAGPGMGTDTIGGFTRIGGIATDVNGYIYASDKEAGVVKVFKPSGEEVTQFPAADAANLAVDTTGAVYVNRRSGNVLKFNPSAPLPVTGATTYTPASQPVDLATSFSVAVDPATNDVYISKTALSPGIQVYDDDGEFITSFGTAGSEGELLEARGLAVEGDGDTTRVYVGNWDNGGISRVKVFQPKPAPPVAPPTIADLGARDVGNTAATLRARITPNSLATVYRFEYGPEDCAVSACTSVPVSPADVGAGHDPVPVSHDVDGLQPGTTYHYRLVAENSRGVEETSRTLRTQGTGIGFELIDRRAWEMVSPPNKRGALVLTTSIGHVQAAADGDGLAYLTGGSIEENPAGSRTEPSSVLAQRGAGGRWTSRDITPPNRRVVPIAVGQQSEYKLFDADLSEALLDPRDGTGLSVESSERGPYWRQNSEPPVYRPLVTGKEPFNNVPPDIEFGGEQAVSHVGIRATTPGLDHVVLASGVGLDSGDPPRATYKWFDGDLEPVSVLPDDEGGETVQGSAGSADGSMRHAISDDGSRIFWTSGEPEQWLKGFTRHLYVRDTVADETVRLDVPSGGSGAGSSEPFFQGASADGSVVFFTANAQLTADASPSGPDLYRCELPVSVPITGCASLDNLSAPLPGSGESSEVLGVVPALSEDGTTAYFVARGKLDTEANQADDFALSGEPNLYVWQEGQGVRFIARLSEEDWSNWGLAAAQEKRPRVALLGAANSPNGRYLAFMSERSLAGESNVDADWEPVQRVFRYDALADRFDCLACHPTGAAPEGEVIGDDELTLIDPRTRWPGRPVAAVVPSSPVIGSTDAFIPLHRARAVHDNGRVFFNAIDALVPADSNGEWDVYQYEPTGMGACEASSGDAATARSAGGCVSLISSGTAEEAAGFFDASVGGDDVFFRTSARLSVLDEDSEHDVYDARVDGVVATRQPRIECLGESCQPPPLVPNDPTPGTATFRGPGDPQPRGKRPCPKAKRKVRRKGKVRCVARKRHGRAGKQRRASR